MLAFTKKNFQNVYLCTNFCFELFDLSAEEQVNDIDQLLLVSDLDIHKTGDLVHFDKLIDFLEDIADFDPPSGLSGSKFRYNLNAATFVLPVDVELNYFRLHYYKVSIERHRDR